MRERDRETKKVMQRPGESQKSRERERKMETEMEKCRDNRVGK